MKSKPKTKRPVGRPRIEIDLDLLDGLAKIHCTVAEMASVLGCSKDTLEKNFSARIEKGRDGGKSSLRRMQWSAAELGNTGMMIWLGKQLLGQKDKLESTGADGGPQYVVVREAPADSNYPATASGTA